MWDEHILIKTKSKNVLLSIFLLGLRRPARPLRDGPLLRGLRHAQVLVARPQGLLLPAGHPFPLAREPLRTPSAGPHLRSRPGLTALRPAYPGETQSPQTVQTANEITYLCWKTIIMHSDWGINMCIISAALASNIIAICRSICLSNQWKTQCFPQPYTLFVAAIPRPHIYRIDPNIRRCFFLGNTSGKTGVVLYSGQYGIYYAN